MFFRDEIHRHSLFTRVKSKVKNKCYNHLDNVSGLAEHAVNLVGCHVIPAKRFTTQSIDKICWHRFCVRGHLLPNGFCTLLCLTTISSGCVNTIKILSLTCN